MPSRFPFPQFAVGFSIQAVGTTGVTLYFLAAQLATATTVPTQDLKLWLSADAGVTLNSGYISAWADQSGNGTNATQPDPNTQPTFLANAVNGRPALKFDGIGDFMTFKLPVNGLTGMTMVLVSVSTDQDGNWNGVENAPLYWGETASWGTVHLSPFQRMVKFRFGTGQSGNLPVYTRPASLGYRYSLTTAIKNSSTESLYVNGTQVLTQQGRLAAIANVSDTGNIGRGYNLNTYFSGEIAEVLVYARALMDAERQQVEQYLLGKYFGASPPPTPSQPPAVNAGPDQTITLPSGATLAGTANDDGLPNGTLTAIWSKVSGPGIVTFANGLWCKFKMKPDSVALPFRLRIDSA
jgi:hypothetical protein